VKAEEFRIPEEVVELYEWRNGQSAEAPFFGGFRFQPFDKAVEYGQFFDEGFPHEFRLLVFQEFDYGCTHGYGVQCRTDDQKSAPVFRWMHEDERIETTSLSALLSAVEEAFEAGAFRPNDQGEFDTDDNLWNSIVLRHHPDRARCVDAVLNREWQGLTAEELRNAFGDLALSNHSETAACVREYFAGLGDGLIRDRETLSTVLGIGIMIQDEWCRDYALRLARSEDPAIRRIGLLELALGWRGELSLSPEDVDELVEQVMSSPVSDLANRERAMLLGRSGDPRAVQPLLLLLDGTGVAGCARDTRIEALRALGQLHAVEARQVCLAIATKDPDSGTRITAVRALLELGFEDAPVEAAAKAWIREMHPRFGTLSLDDENPTLIRWVDEVRQSIQG
jgi:hypothetical protein